jgi:DNA-binding IclR family transcriptional regulator
LTKTKEKKLHNPTLRVINILELLDEHPEGLTLTELSEKTDIPKSTISPIIYTLQNKNYIIVDKSSNKYKLDIKSFTLGKSYLLNLNSIDVIKKEMEDIVKICNETCQLGVLIDFDVLYLAKVDPNQPIKLVSSVGKKLPAYATALGKALLSDYSDSEIINYYKKHNLEPITKNTITDINELLKQINEVRKGKVAYDYAEINEDIGCRAVPLRKDGKIVAAISVSFPLYRATKDRIELIEKTLLEKQTVIEQLIKQLDLKL